MTNNPIPISSAPHGAAPEARPENPSNFCGKKILLVEDHPVTRRGLRAVIDQQPDLAVCGEAGSAEEAMALCSRCAPDVAVVDVGLGAGDGLEVTRNLKSVRPELQILVVSMHDESVYAERALRCGASGYIMKQEAADSLVTGIRRLLAGDLCISERVKRRMLHSMVSKRGEDAMFCIDTLSPREMEVFQLIGEGFSTRQIAEKLRLSPKTVDSYREHLKIKLNLDTGVELLRYAVLWCRGNAA